jgi:hypothetical protein
MGNQQSSPPPSPTPAPPPPPPPPPPITICDLDCQKQKQLALLKTELDTASDNQDEDPAGYEKARIAYYTLLNGQGWLNTEKQRIATQEVQPVVSSYNTKYNALKGEKQAQSIFVNLANNLKAQESSDKENSAFLKKELISEKDKADVLSRLNELNAGTPYTTSSTNQYISMFIDLIIVFLIVIAVYLGYSKFMVPKQSILSSVTGTTT